MLVSLDFSSVFNWTQDSTHASCMLHSIQGSAMCTASARQTFSFQFNLLKLNSLSELCVSCLLSVVYTICWAYTRSSSPRHFANSCFCILQYWNLKAALAQTPLFRHGSIFLPCFTWIFHSAVSSRFLKLNYTRNKAPKEISSSSLLRPLNLDANLLIFFIWADEGKMQALSAAPFGMWSWKGGNFIVTRAINYKKMKGTKIECNECFIGE